jgi:hypothetical protein
MDIRKKFEITILGIKGEGKAGKTDAIMKRTRKKEWNGKRGRGGGEGWEANTKQLSGSPVSILI